MNSTITIDDTDENLDIINLDTSQDDIDDIDNDQSNYSIEKNSLSNHNTSKKEIIIENVENNSSIFKTEICDNTSAPKPLFKVIFRDESVSRHYSKRIKEFLEELVSSKIKSQENDNGLTLEIWDNDTDSTNQSIEITTKSDDSQDIICETLFTVDTQPKLKDDFDVPSYGKKYKNLSNDTQPEPNPKQNDDCVPKLLCFNCLENHKLQDCPHEWSQDIKEKYRKTCIVKGNPKTLRYHLQTDQKFAHIIPGQLSNNLRRALGLKKNELPKHIYRMRSLGYPPGWLEEARLQHSGLTLFNSDGVAEAESSNEPDLVIKTGDKDQYDVKKIYDFPGFNVPPPSGTHDECGQYWVSNMWSLNSKERMLLLLNEKKADDGYKRKKLKICNNTSTDDVALVPSEMEIDNAEEVQVVESIPVNGLFVPPLPPESIVKPPEPLEQPPITQLPPLPPLPPEPSIPQPQTISEDLQSQELPFSESLEDSASLSSRANSPSLSELENIKKRLLVELQESNSNSDVSSKSNLSNSVPKTDAPPPNIETTPTSNRAQQNEANTSCGSIKSVDLGTYVLQSTSPYSKLPSFDKFSKDICDVINFENLPDSTGKYKQMTRVLQKVRNTMAKLQQE